MGRLATNTADTHQPADLKEMLLDVADRPGNLLDHPRQTRLYVVVVVGIVVVVVETEVVENS